MEYNTPPARLHKTPSAGDFTTARHSTSSRYSHSKPPNTLRRAPSAPVRSRYKDVAGGHSRRGTLPDLNIPDSDKDTPIDHAAHPTDLHRLSEASGELLAPHLHAEPRPDSLAIFSSHAHTFATATPSHHPRPVDQTISSPPSATNLSSLSRPSQPPRSQTTGRLSLRHTLSTRGLKRPSIIGIMDSASPSSRSNNSSFTTTDGTASPRQRYSDEIKSKKKTGLASFMTGLMKSNSRPAISAPANPLHVVHVGVDSATGEFTVCNMSHIFPP